MVEMMIVFPRNGDKPKSVPSAVWATGAAVWRPTTNKDDLDRLQGNIYDALKDAGVIVDDGHVVFARVGKVWAEKGGEPRLELKVTEARWDTLG